MTFPALLPIIQAAEDDGGLTLGGILAGIPHDAASIFIYVILLVSVGWVIRAGRQKKKSTDADVRGEP